MTNAARAVGIALLGILLAGGCRTASPVPTPVASVGQNDLTNAVAWIQTAAEADALRRQVFFAARKALDDALADPSWTAAHEQVESFEALPPAVIVDVDETVLDNSPLEARFVRRGQTFSPELWREWVEERKATPVPGALEFVRYAASRGVTMFYVTNRSFEEEPATRDNLLSVGFPVESSLDVVLTKDEDGAPSDKTSRRAIVASTHRILLMLGDDLGDFTSREGSVQERLERVRANEQRWGVSWFVLPNPMYGSWERAIEGRSGPGKVESLDEAVD